MTTRAAAADAAIAIIGERTRLGLPTTADDVRVQFGELGVTDKQVGGIFRRAERAGIIHRDPDWRPRNTRERLRWLPGPAPDPDPDVGARAAAEIGVDDILQVPVRRGSTGRFVARHVTQQPAIPAFPLDEVL